MGGSTLLLLLIPPGAPGPPPSSGVTQFVGPFGWSFWFQSPSSASFISYIDPTQFSVIEFSSLDPD